MGETSVTVKYKLVDGWHVFTSEDLPGLYVASQDAKLACNDIAPAIEKLIELDTGVRVKAEAQASFADFLRQLQEPAPKATKKRARIPRLKVRDFQKRDPVLVLSEKRFSLRRA